MVTLIEYNKNVDELLKSRNVERTYFELLFNAYTGEKIDIDLSVLSDIIIQKLFSISMYDKQPVIPYEFFNSPVGKVFLHVKFNCNDSDKFFVKDVAHFANVSQQQIIKDIHDGNIKAVKLGRDWTFNIHDIDDYLVKKGLQPLNRKKIVSYIEQEEKIFNRTNNDDIFENCFNSEKK